MMKKAFFPVLVGVFCVVAGACFANSIEDKKVSACVLEMPPVILIDEDIRDFNFSKAQRVDAFFSTFETDEKKIAMQQYRNGFCEAKIQIGDHEYGRLSKAKLKRILKNDTPFTIEKQKSLKIGKKNLILGSLKNEDVAQTVIVGAHQKMLLRIYTSCAILNRFDQEEYDRRIEEMNTILAEAIVSHLLKCDLSHSF